MWQWQYFVKYQLSNPKESDCFSNCSTAFISVSTGMVFQDVESGLSLAWWYWQTPNSSSVNFGFPIWLCQSSLLYHWPMFTLCLFSFLDWYINSRRWGKASSAQDVHSFINLVAQCVTLWEGNFVLHSGFNKISAQSVAGKIYWHMLPPPDLHLIRYHWELSHI